MKITWIKKRDGEKADISGVITSVSWSGSVEQASRELSISVLNAPNDINIKKLKLNIATGDILSLYEDKKLIFYGEVQTSEKKAEIGTITYKARDLMNHLLRINHKQNFKNKTAEGITREICRKYGIKIGQIAETKKEIKKMIIDDASLYDIIMMAYTKAAKSTGEKYMTYMEGTKLCTKIKGTIVKGYALDEYRNLISASYEESIENIINKVKIYSEKGVQIGEVKNNESIKRYGIFQSLYIKERGVNPDTAGKNLLNGIEKKVSTEAIDGNIKCVAGDGVKVYDSATGLYGLFWISSDTHTWENGQHKMSLELSFKNIMDKKEIQ